jgi:hypothetical protein
MFRIPGNGQRSNLLLEILMIVIGINVALWFEGWFQDVQNAEIEQRYLLDLREDLLTNIKNLDVVIRFGTAKSLRAASIIEKMPRIAELSPDEIAQAIYTPPNYQFFTPSDFTYKSMQDSGDFRLLRSAEIKKSILRLDRRHNEIASLQKNFLQALDDGYIPLMMRSFDIATTRITDPSILQNQMFQNFFVYTVQDTDAMVALYRVARSESEDLIKLIDEQISAD